MKSISLLNYFLIYFFYIYSRNNYVYSIILSYSSIPSLIILGTSKGGTTDLWDLLHYYHLGFLSISFSTLTTNYLSNFSNSSNSSTLFNSSNHLKSLKSLKVIKSQLIHPWKELDFFSLSSYNNICYIQSKCTINKMKILLNCPTNIFQTFLSSPTSSSSSQFNYIYELCWKEIQKRNILPSLYSATASPSLFFSAKLASPILMKFYQITKTSPLFIVLFRNPIDWIISMYNHGMVFITYYLLLIILIFIIILFY